MTKVSQNQSDHLAGGCCTCRSAAVVVVVVSPWPHRFHYFVFHSVSECFRSCAPDVGLHCSSAAAVVLVVGAAEDVAWSGSDASSSCDWDWRS